MSEVNSSRIDQAFNRLQAYPLRDASLDTRFRDWIVSAGDDNLHRINAYTLGTSWNLDPDKILGWLIYASQVGLFDLNWETHCTHCGGSSNSSTRLGALGHDSSCKMCQNKFEV